MGEALRGDAPAGGARGRAAGLGARRACRRAAGAVVAHLVTLLALLAAQRTAPAAAQSAALERLERLEQGRFTLVAERGDLPLARSLLAAAAARDSFPGLPRPRARVLIEVAPDERRFREWIGDGAPEWGIAFALPAERRIIMQGRRATSEAGDHLQVLRHELAHLALHEAMGWLPPRWFDEGYASYAAGEWGREEVLATSYALVLRGLPTLDSLDFEFRGGSVKAGAGYALAYRAVSDIAALDPQRGLSLFFTHWKRSGSLDLAMRQAYGLTLHDFERRWRDRTMRRYGLLAFVADLTAAIAVVGMLVVPLYVVRRRRDRRRLEAMRAADEAAERAARESALDELLRAAEPAPPRSELPPGPAARPPPGSA